jgi:hypothetical protein
MGWFWSGDKLFGYPDQTLAQMYITKPFIDIRCTLHLIFISKRYFFYTKKYVWSLKDKSTVTLSLDIEKYFLKLFKLINIDKEATTQIFEFIEKNTFIFDKQFNNGITSKLAWYKISVKSSLRSRVVTATDGQTRPSVTSDKVLVHQIRINAMLTSDKVKPELLCPRWLPR